MKEFNYLIYILLLMVFKNEQSLRLDFITNGVVKGITSKDAKSFHINVFGCKNLTIEHITVTAPETSHNTDGIHIGRSSGIIVTDTTIGTGDDCISLGDGSQDVTIERVNCGPGHGISIGSLGKYKNEEPVSQIKVLDCTITGTTNGIRIKTWPNSVGASTASDITFKGITMDNVANPVIITQGYCPYGQCKAQVR
jgi:galacturan 1,4-alpha-galacturonidase